MAEQEGAVAAAARAGSNGAGSGEEGLGSQDPTVVEMARRGELAVMDSALLAEYIRLQPRTIRGYITQHGFPSIQVEARGSHLFRKEEVDEWLRLRRAGVALEDAVGILRRLVEAETIEDLDGATAAMAEARALVEKADSGR